MKKIIFLSFIVLLLSGCSAEYNLVIDDVNEYKFEETGIISSIDKNSISSIYDSEWPSNAYSDAEYYSEAPVKIEGVDYYNVNSYYDGNYNVRYQFTFPSSGFEKSSGVKTGFYNFKKTYNKNDNTTTLDTGYFNYQKFSNLEQLVVRVTINNKVISHNASNVNGNVYTWILNQENFASARLILTYEGGYHVNEEVPDIVPDEDDKDSAIVLFLFLALFGIFIIVVFIYNYRQRNQS